VHQYLDEPRHARECAEAAIALASEQGFPYWLAWATVLRGWALAEQGSSEEGVGQMCEGLAAYQATGSVHGRPYFLALLALGYQSNGQTQAGLDVLDDALAIVGNTGERYYEAELHRLKGELLLCSSTQAPLTTNRDVAKAYFHQAIAIARRQSAKSLELRAALSLARLWQQQGKPEVARQTLACVHVAFTEGFGTADWMQAKALLDALT